MLFHSWVFLFFATVFFPSYYLTPSRHRNWLLLIASYVFYGAWDARFLLLLFGSTVLDYVIGLRLARTTADRSRRGLLAVSVIGNLGALAFFKYYNFFVDSATALLAALGFDPSVVHLDIVLPVGISFYTFQTLGYTIDIYRGELQPTRSFRDYALYVAYFPQLVAGPIERARHLLPQLRQSRVVTLDHVASGIWLISWGLFKKAVIADNLAIVVDRTFARGADASGVEYLVAVYAFAYQIYCDFSGYSDIARGLASLMGIDIMRNFDRPYLATSPREFWRRWHISLSTWLRDYLYIPLGGSRGGRWTLYRSLFITMLLGGLWHGAKWTFVVWGAYHGVLLAMHRWLSGTRDRPRAEPWVARAFARVVMFHLVCFGWFLFRADSLSQVVNVLTHAASGLDMGSVVVKGAAVLAPVVGVLWLVERTWGSEEPALVSRTSGLAVAAMWVGILVLAPPTGQPFIYFQF